MFLIWVKEDYEASVLVAGRTKSSEALKHADERAAQLDVTHIVYVTEIPNGDFTTDDQGLLHDMYSVRGHL